MGQSNVRVFIHSVWTTRFREPLILPSFEEKLYEFIKEDFKKFDSNVLAINGMPDHIHILYWLHQSHSIASVIKHVKGASSFWINQQKFMNAKFAWQGGFSALSIQYNGYERVVDYINNQKVHHSNKNFIAELEDL